MKLHVAICILFASSNNLASRGRRKLFYIEEKRLGEAYVIKIEPTKFKNATTNK